MKHSQVSFKNSLGIIEVGNCYKGVRISNWVLKPSEFPYNWLLYINQDNRCSGTKFSFVQVTFFSIFLSWQPWADPEKGTYKLYRSYLFCWEFFKTNIEFHKKRFGHSPLGQPLNLPMYCILQPIECNLRISIIDVFWYLLLFHCCYDRHCQVDSSHYSLSTSPKSLRTSLSVIRNGVILMNCSLKNSRHFTTPPLKWNRSFCKRAEKSNVEWRSRQNTQVIALSTQAFCHPLLSAVVLHKLTYDDISLPISG